MSDNIVVCKNCETKNRIPGHWSGRRPICSVCKVPFGEITLCLNPSCTKKLRIPVNEDIKRVKCPSCNSSFFLCSPTVPPGYEEFENAAYVDIETTSLSPSEGIITVLGIYLVEGCSHLIIQLTEHELNKDKLFKIMDKKEVIYTFNGKRFDLPFIKEFVGIDLSKHHHHIDIMRLCHDNGYPGGLKLIEQRLGIQRKNSTIDGREAVNLWNRWRYEKDNHALSQLLDYNKEDVFNLRTLRLKLKRNHRPLI
ncbi:MAG: ribonuclease H-like domain-containing protein [Syntrophaceae bacterium]|nr:ribonuclease H-like domain-containing protein [Syntrophaceae bacterium]